MPSGADEICSKMPMALDISECHRLLVPIFKKGAEAVSQLSEYDTAVPSWEILMLDMRLQPIVEPQIQQEACTYVDQLFTPASIPKGFVMCGRAVEVLMLVFT